MLHFHFSCDTDNFSEVIFNVLLTHIILPYPYDTFPLFVHLLKDS